MTVAFSHVAQAWDWLYKLYTTSCGWSDSRALLSGMCKLVNYLERYGSWVLFGIPTHVQLHLSNCTWEAQTCTGTVASIKFIWRVQYLNFSCFIKCAYTLRSNSLAETKHPFFTTIMLWHFSILTYTHVSICRILAISRWTILILILTNYIHMHQIHGMILSPCHQASWAVVVP
jgi:hypothetical protein